MSLQEEPLCFDCAEPVDPVSMVFEAPCGHDEHPSAVFHGLCLMRWRDDRERVYELLSRMADEHYDLLEQMAEELHRAEDDE